MRVMCDADLAGSRVGGERFGRQTVVAACQRQYQNSGSDVDQARLRFRMGTLSDTTRFAPQRSNLPMFSVEMARKITFIAAAGA